MTRDFRVQIRLKNNQLVERREAMGLSVKAFAEKFKLTYSDYVYLETLHDSPLTKPRGRGQTPTWRQICIRIAEVHRVDPAVLWPEAVLMIERSRAELRMSAEEVFTLANSGSGDLGPLQHVERRELQSAISKAVLSLPPRQAQVIKLKYIGGLSNERAAKRMKVSEQRVSALEASALRKMRHPSRADPIREAAGIPRYREAPRNCGGSGVLFDWNNSTWTYDELECPGCWACRSPRP